MKVWIVLLLAASAVDLPAEAETPPKLAAPEAPAIRDLGDGRMQIGTITIRQDERSLSFPAAVNMTEGLLEFAIVQEKGKIHESLLHTETDPFNLNVALKLLRYKPSEELFEIRDEDFKGTGKFPEVSEETRIASRAEILVSWKTDDGEATAVGLNDLITYAVTNQPLPVGPWIYNGSYIANGAFQARSTGDIAAIFTSQTALFNYPGRDRDLDDVWVPTPKRVPPVGTPVTVTIKPFTTAAPAE